MFGISSVGCVGTGRTVGGDGEGTGGVGVRTGGGTEGEGADGGGRCVLGCGTGFSAPLLSGSGGGWFLLGGTVGFTDGLCCLRPIPPWPLAISPAAVPFPLSFTVGLHDMVRDGVTSM